MSSDERTARSRLLPPADVGPGPVRDFKDALRRLYLRDPVTLDQLEARIQQMADVSETNPGCEPMATPGRDTIRAVISDAALPQNVHVVTAVAAGLVFYRHEDLASVSVLDDPTVRQVRELWSHAAAQRPIGKKISEARLVEDLGVHSVGRIDADGVALLPPYIERSHDEALHRLVERALAGRSGIGIVISDSSAGKTRACAEALHWAPDPKTGSLADNGWRVWPSTVPAPRTARAMLDEIPMIGPRTVVWLNEAQRFLLDPAAQVSQRIAAELRAMLTDRSRGPVLILGTLWPDYWRRITAPPVRGQADPYAPARALIESHGIRVENNFTASVREAARATGNEMLIDAIDHAVDGEVAQYLAGVPDLLSRFDLGSVTDRAIIHAAMDARRLGHGEWIPSALLRDAAPAYLTATDQRRLHRNPDWFADTIDSLTRPGKADSTVLEPGPDDAYRLDDYLDQHGRLIRYSVVPLDPFWDAVAAHTDDPEIVFAVALSAWDSFRLQIAARLLRVGAEAGHARCLTSLVQLLDKAGHHQEAERLTRKALASGDTHALLSLAETRLYNGDPEASKQLCHEAALSTDLTLLASVANCLDRAGDAEAADAIHRRIAASISPDNLDPDLVDSLERTGNAVAAERLMLREAEAGKMYSLTRIVGNRLLSGDKQRAVRLIERAVAAGQVKNLGKCVIPDLFQDTEHFVHLAQAVAEAGDPGGFTTLAKYKMSTGDLEAAQKFIQKALAAGDTTDAMELQILIWARNGRLDLVEVLFQVALAEERTPPALMALAWLKQNKGDSQAAEQLACEALQAGDPDAPALLAEIKEAAGDQEGAEAVFEAVARAGKYPRMDSLIALREETDPVSAEQLALRALDWPTRAGIVSLAEIRERAGDIASAERLARLAVDTGWSQTLEFMADRLEGERWHRLLSFGVNADGSDAEPW